MIIKDSGLIDTRLYDNPILLAKILYELDDKLTEEEKEIIKFKFLKTYEWRRWRRIMVLFIIAIFYFLIFTVIFLQSIYNKKDKE